MDLPITSISTSPFSALAPLSMPLAPSSPLPTAWAPPALASVPGGFTWCTGLSFIFTYIFPVCQHNDDAYTHSLTTPLFSYHRTRLLSRELDVFRQPPCSSRKAS